jgi:hypothetical protein
MSGRQFVALGDLGLPGFAAAERSAFGQQLGPAARWMAPSTPPPPSRLGLAALTMASTFKVVMSATTISMRCCMGNLAKAV